LLVLLAPQQAIDPVGAAEGLAVLARNDARPLLACWLWEAARPASLAVLGEAGIPTFRSVEEAVRTFGYLWRHAENLRFLSEIRAALPQAEEEAVDPARAEEVVRSARAAGRVVLSADEVERLFSAYGLPIQQRRCAEGAAGAVAAAEALGYPVLVELDGPAASAAGLAGEGEAVRLRADDPAGVRRAVRVLELVAREHFGVTAPRVAVLPLVSPGAVEVAVHSTRHGELGPFIALGPAGPPEAPGRAVRALAPLTPLTAREMIEHGPLTGSRSGGQQPVEPDALERFLLRLSRLAVEQPAVREVNVRSLLLWDGRVMAREVCVCLAC
jgi:acetyltransferase